MRLRMSSAQPGPADERVHDDGDDHHREQEVGAAAHVRRVELLRRLGGELDVVLVRGDRLVLGAVVHEDALDVLHLADEQQVAEEDAEAQRALGDVEPEAVDAEEVAEAVGRDRGQHDEDRGEERERDADRPPHRLGGDLLLFGDLAVGRPRERLHAERHRLGQRHHAAHQRDLRPLLRPVGRVVGLDLDVALGRAHRDRVRCARRAS